MAYVSSHRTAGIRFSDVLAQAIGRLTDAVQRRRTYVQTLAELSALTDRELADMDLHRVNLEEIAREAAYGK